MMYIRKACEPEIRVKLGYRRTRHAKPCKDMRYVCQVCGDVAFGYNFNAITCESCKSFFRRQVQTPSIILTCTSANDCKVTKDTRKHCPACRMKKCEAVGMSRLRVPPVDNDKQRSEDGSWADSPATIDTDQLGRLPLKERYKVARKILDDFETIVSSNRGSKEQLELAEMVTRCGTQMVAPFAMPDMEVISDEPHSLERLMYTQQLERRFVSILEGCRDFAGFSKKEQQDLLKRGMLNYHSVLSAFYLDVDSSNNGNGCGGWRIPLIGRESLWVPKDLIYGSFERTAAAQEIRSFFDANVAFAASMRKRFGSSWSAVQFSLTLIQLFSPFSLEERDGTATFNSDDSAHMARCTPLHYKYANFLQVYCDWLDEQLKPDNEEQTDCASSSWSFCMSKLVEIQLINRRFQRALTLLSANRQPAC